MKITEKPQEDDPDLRVFDLTIPAKTIDERIDQQIAEIAPKTSMSGFRPGKVPVALLRKNYAGQLTEDALQATINEGIAKIVQEQAFVPAMDPDIQVDQYEVGKDLRCTIQFVPLPTIELPNFETIELQRPLVTVEEQHVRGAIKHLQLRRSTSKAIETRAFAKDDILVIDYTGHNEDNKPVDGVGGNDVHVLLGQNSFSEELEAELLKAKVGQTVSHTITYPDNHHRPDLRGHSITYLMTVKELHEQVVPEIDAEFAQFYGFPSVEAMQDMIKQSLDSEYQQEAREVLKRRLLDALHFRFKDLRVPQKMSEREYSNIWQQYITSRQENTLSEEEAALDDNQARDMFGKLSKRRVLLALVLTSVSREYNIGVNDQELQQAIENMIRSHPEEAKHIRETYQQATARQQLQAGLTEQKIVDFILEKIKTEDESLSVEELQQIVREANSLKSDDYAESGDTKVASTKKTKKKTSTAKTSTSKSAKEKTTDEKTASKPTTKKPAKKAPAAKTKKI